MIDKIDGNFEVYADEPGTLQDILLEKMEGVSTNLQTAKTYKNLIAAHGFPSLRRYLGRLHIMSLMGTSGN